MTETRIAVIGDTHVIEFDELPEQFIQSFKKVDMIIHLGDFTSPQVLNGFLSIKKPIFKGVYGNSDPQSVREKLPFKDILEIEGNKIGIIHPASGGSLNDIEVQIINEFKNESLDVIMFGHTHYFMNEIYKDILFLNPGQGYKETSFGPQGSFLLITIGDTIQVKKIKI